MKALARRFLQDEAGAFSLMAAAMAIVLIGFAGLAIDTSSVLYWQRRLQSAADAAAMAATFDVAQGSAIAQTRLQALGFPASSLASATLGYYDDDPATPAANRFQTGAPSPNAMHITVLYQAPVYLMRVLTGSTTTPISVSATAYQQPLGGIAISTGLVDGNLGQVNALLQSASGSATLQLSQAERDALDRTPVPLFRIFDGLAASQGSTARAIADVDAASATLKTLAQSAVDALTKSGASSSDAQTSIAALTRLAQQSQSSTAVPVSDIIAMAAHQARAAQDLVSTASDAVSVPALPVLSAYSQAAGNGELVDLAPSLPGGIASIEIALARPSALGQTDRSAIAIGPEGTNASTAIGLIKVTISIAGLGIVPIIIELDAGNATITDVSCGADLMTSTAMTVNAQNGVVKAYIGLLNSLSDLTGPLPSVPLGLVQVSAASGNVGIGQVTQTFSFTRSDISAGTPKSVGTASALSTALNGLVTNLTVQPNIPIVTAAVKTTLTTALNAIEPVLNGLLTSLGVRLGYMDVRATTVRCGIPALVD